MYLTFLRRDIRCPEQFFCKRWDFYRNTATFMHCHLNSKTGRFHVFKLYTRAVVLETFFLSGFLAGTQVVVTIPATYKYFSFLVLE